jgi:hypothetical protein
MLLDITAGSSKDKISMEYYQFKSLTCQNVTELEPIQESKRYASTSLSRLLHWV